VLLQDGLQQMGLDAEFGSNDAGHARGPIQQRVTHGAGDFINRRIGGRDIEQAALDFIKCQALVTCSPEMLPIFGRVCFSRGRTNETQQVQR
jgi:hypothetical protein